MEQMMSVKLDISTDQFMAALRATGLGDRLHDMVDKYGEITSRNQAMKILHCGDVKLDELIARGKIRTACEGDAIDTRSIW